MPDHDTLEEHTYSMYYIVNTLRFTLQSQF